MTKAIDLVLLPSENLKQELLEINDRLEKDGIDFRSGCLPHLTLAMAAVDQELLPELWEKMSALFTGIKLKQNGVVSLHHRQKALCHLKFERSDELMKLHEQSVSTMRDFQKKAPEESMFYKGRAGEGTVNYARSFLAEHTGINFDPHITLGYGESEYQMKQEVYSFDKLALCHLGDHNTCREILFELDLER
ncbi:hypothetical protein [Halocola ammonii]